MTESVKGFQTTEGTKQYDYNALANRPTLITQNNIDIALSAAKKYTDDEIAKIDVGGNENYVTDTELQSAVNEALAQAKASGEFKGDKGDTPIKGTDYFTQSEISSIIAATTSEVLAQFTDVSKVGA